MTFSSSPLKRNLFPLCLLFLTLNLAAQDLDKIASLQHQLKSAKGTGRFDLLNKIAFEYRSSYPDSTIAFGIAAIDNARQFGIKKGIATSLNYIGLGNYYKGNLVRAFEYYEEAAREATESLDSTQLGYAQNNIGRLFSEQGMLTQSYPYFARAEAIFQSTHNESGLAYVYQSFAALYKTEQDFVKSEQRYQEALKIRLKLKNTRDIMSAMVLLGKLYMEIKRYDDALMYLQKADSAGRVIHDDIGLAEIRILTAEYYTSKKETAKAKELCEQGLAYILNSSNVRLVPRAYLVLGEIYFKENNFPVAKKYFTIALNVSSRMKYLDLSMQSHYYLWKISEKVNDRPNELFHSNQYLVLKDSVNDIHVSEKLAKFQFQTEIERKQRENDILKANQSKSETIIQHQNQQRVVLVIIAILIGAMAWVQWRNSKRRKKMNAELGKMVDETNERNRVLHDHLTTLVEFSKSKAITFGSVVEAVSEIAQLTAHSLNVSRISVWSYDENDHTIMSIACYDLKSEKFLDTMTLDLKQVPAYEEAIRSKRIIEASDARTHQVTREFKDSYLLPLDIHSMLDVTYSHDGELDGLICCEQQGAPRVWKSEDIIFVSSVADIISLAYRAVQRRDYEKQLRTQTKEIARMNELLEQRVIERTKELENRNRQLTEYVFINSHLLRSPVSKIMGLINLMEVDKASDPQEMMNHLRRSCNELDAIVQKITITLDGGEHLDRSMFGKKD